MTIKGRNISPEPLLTLAIKRAARRSSRHSALLLLLASSKLISRMKQTNTYHHTALTRLRCPTRSVSQFRSAFWARANGLSMQSKKKIYYD